MIEANPETSPQKPHGKGSVFRQMYRITADSEATFEQKTRRLIDIGRKHLGLPYGFLTYIEGSLPGDRGISKDGGLFGDKDREGPGSERTGRDSGDALPETKEPGDEEPMQRILYASGEHPMLQEGETCPLSEAYCRKTIQQEELLSIQNAAAEGWGADPAYQRFDLGSYIGAKVVVDGELYGTFCFASHEARGRSFSDEEEAFVELLTRWASYELERQRSQDRVERFAELVTHDLKNPLNAAQMHLHLARRRLGLSSEEPETSQSYSGEERSSDEKTASDDQENTFRETTSKQTASQDSKIREHLNVTERALGRMEEIIANTLALTQGGDPLGPDDMEPINLKSVAETSWDQISSEEATLQVENTDQGDHASRRTLEKRAPFLAHEGRLRQLLENLFRNAVDHAGPNVTVTVGQTKNGFFVADNGPGIPEPKREQIFESGYSSTGKGTGFGLSIADMIAQSHGWTLLVTESTEGGARFEVRGVQMPVA
jgi:signal transduction histidine kinase